MRMFSPVNNPLYATGRSLSILAFYIFCKNAKHVVYACNEVLENITLVHSILAPTSNTPGNHLVAFGRINHFWGIKVTSPWGRKSIKCLCLPWKCSRSLQKAEGVEGMGESTFMCGWKWNLPRMCSFIPPNL